MNQMENPKLLIPRIIWGALLMSQIMLLVVVSTTNPFNGATALSDLQKNPVNYVFLVIALFNFVAAYALPNFIAMSSLKDLKKINPLLQSEQVDFLKMGFPPLVIRLALIEAATLFGFLLATQNQNAALILFTFIPAVLLHLINLPTEKLIKSFFGRLL